MQKIIIKECWDCKEIMPRLEKICYCGGPIKTIAVNGDSKENMKAINYYKRQLIYNLRNNDG